MADRPWRRRRDRTPGRRRHRGWRAPGGRQSFCGRFENRRKSSIGFRAHHSNQPFQMRQHGFDRSRDGEVAVGGIVSNEVGDDCRRETDVATVVLDEATRPHRFSEIMRRLFGIEEGNDQVALQRVEREMVGQQDVVRDGGGVVVHAGRVDDAVVVGP